MMEQAISELEIRAPAVPESAVRFMPSAQDSLGLGLLNMLREAATAVSPELEAALAVCLGVLAAVILVSIVKNTGSNAAKSAVLAGIAAVSVTLLNSSDSMIRLAGRTVIELSEYGKLLIPVMTTALAAQGGVGTSAALCAGAVGCNTLLSNLISSILLPMINAFLALNIASGAIGEDILKKLRDTVKWLISWSLKIVLYGFTGFLSLTGVISGTADSAALKTAKITISGVVPVVGGILSEASEALLVGAGIVKNSVGVYGLFAVLAILIGPFVRIGIHYLMLKATAALCALFAEKALSDLIDGFSAALGLLLAMTGSVCLMLVISTVCFMRGVGG